ncbi:TorF family putative porin [Massilia sp. W12]|uniref:TorF family putative porin n=1 Tax=Massilia sp. W12 TaxID=3126507 RepID=UPI0030CECE19
MKTILRASAIGAVLCLAGVNVQAQEKKPEHEVSANLGIASDYRYRGLSQTRLQPAVQGGVDYVNNAGGWYAGAWASTIKWTKDVGGSGDIELDLYAGKRGEIAKDWAYDVGLLTYVYPSNGLTPNVNTTELYGQISYQAVSLKYSRSLSNLFGVADSKGSGYLDLSANLPLADGFTLNLHVGRQSVKNAGALSYTDYKLGLSKEFSFATLALAVIGTNTKVYVAPNGKNLGKSALVLTASKTF